MAGEFHLLAPGPSMSQAVADSVRGKRVGVVGCCYQLAPWAEFLASTDMDWWDKYPDAYAFAGLKYAGQNVCRGVMRAADSTTDMNSGVLALTVAAQLGARTIYLYGFDMHGSHYFGEYTNGLPNTPEYRRRIHIRQYEAWAMNHAGIRVINRTPGSALTCFKFEETAA